MYRFFKTKIIKDDDGDINGYGDSDDDDYYNDGDNNDNSDCCCYLSIPVCRC